MNNEMHEGHRARMRKSAESDPDLNSFNEYQTMEFLLSYLIPRKDTNPIAHTLIDTFGNLNAVFHANYDELFSIPNMTSNAASFLTHFYSFVRKSELSKEQPRPTLQNVTEAAKILAPYFYERDEERIYCAALDLNDKLLQVALIGEGGVDNVAINNNKILGIVTRTKAKKIIIAHNHPAGNLNPSKQDIDATNTLFIMLSSANSLLSDHIIFSDKGYFSFYEHGLLDSYMQRYDNIYGTNTYEEKRKRSPLNYYIFEPPEKEK